MCGPIRVCLCAVACVQEAKRLASAESLVDMGLGTKDLCVMALQLNRDDVDRAAEWLMGPQAQAFVSGRGLEKNVGDANPRWGAARCVFVCV